MSMRSIFTGVLIGIACILPGASGGVLAVAFGLYRPMLDALMNFFKAPGKHFRFLAPLASGIFAGIILGAVCLSDAMARHERLMLFLFTGLIIGGIPDLLREAQQQEPLRLSWLGALSAGALAALPLYLASPSGAAVLQLSPVQSFLTGVLEGIGTVVPGVSTSFVLLRLGWYQAYLTAMAARTPASLMLILSGFALSALGCMHVVNRLFDRHTGPAFFGVLGFVLVSVALVFPGFTLGMRFWAEAALMIIGIVTVRWIGRLEKYRGVMK